GAVAVRAGLRNREDSLALGLDATSTADRTDLGRGSWLCPATSAGWAGLRGGHGQRDLGTLHRLIEAQRDLGLQIAAARRGATASDPASSAGSGTATARSEEVGEDIAHATETASEGAGVEPAAGHVEPEWSRTTVILLALLGVGKNVVGLGDLLEPLFRFLVAGVAVGVVLARQPAVGLLYLGLRGVLANPEDFVVVGSCGHDLRLLTPLQPRGRAAARSRRAAGTHAGRPRRWSLGRHLGLAAGPLPRDAADRIAPQAASKARSPREQARRSLRREPA